MAEALSNLLIADLGDSVATAYCGKLYAALGARVVNIETLPAGHRTRQLPPSLKDDGRSDRSALHAWLSARKESVTFNPTEDASLERVRNLCDQADLVLV
jgi:succinate--hydroxymethylglutarate CoA-transferase